MPLIYSPRSDPVRLHLKGRFVALAVGLGCLSVLLTAMVLVPSPTGIGTHTALGLERCGFERTFGLPCPFCGMTTSFAWFVRGNWVASFYIQPMGLVLAFLTTVGFWAGSYIAVTGRAAHRLIDYLPGGYIVWPLLVFALIAWGWKIYIHLGHLDGWR